MTRWRAGSAENFAAMAVALRAPAVPEVCRKIVEFARALTGCDRAEVALVDGWGSTVVSESIGAGSLSGVAGPDRVLTEVDGPRLAVLAGADQERIPDLGLETRWPDWCAAAVLLGVSSVLSLRLTADGATFGALTLYSTRPDAFRGAGNRNAGILARHASVALAAVREQEGLHTALDTRTVIAQAQGVLMERYGINADQAFAVLRRYSQDGNVKLFDVAAEVIGTRRLPESH